MQTLPADIGGILRYLSSGAVKGIRSATAEKIVEAFGTQTFDVLENDPVRLAKIKGISAAKARQICTDFKSQFAAKEVLIGLTNLGMSQNQAVKIVRSSLPCQNQF